MLQWIVDDIEQYIDANNKAAQALTSFVNAWHSTAEHFTELAALGTGDIQPDSAERIRSALTTVRSRAAALKSAAEGYESASLLPVVHSED
ncbi:hypothetical protein GXW82_32105 [Streptacidiphilus sp. 4-A2]|nr:hypothetical protein [Streptacidiphilus sp. 4-A2]